MASKAVCGLCEMDWHCTGEVVCWAGNGERRHRPRFLFSQVLHVREGEVHQFFYYLDVFTEHCGRLLFSSSNYGNNVLPAHVFQDAISFSMYMLRTDGSRHKYTCTKPIIYILF